MDDATANRATVFKLNSLDNDSMLTDAQAHLGPDAGFTVMPNNEVLFSDYEGDARFGAKISALRERLGDNVADLHYTAVRANYGDEVNWQTDPEGRGAEARVQRTALGSPALQAWVRDRRAAFERLFEEIGKALRGLIARFLSR